MSGSTRVSIPHSISTRRDARSLERHDLHHAVDRDWSSPRPSPADLRGSLAAGLAMMATLPVVTLLVQHWPDASRGATVAIASLPLLALLLCAMAWRGTDPRPEAPRPGEGGS